MRENNYTGRGRFCPGEKCIFTAEVSFPLPSTRNIKPKEIDLEKYSGLSKGKAGYHNKCHFDLTPSPPPPSQ